MIRPCALAVVAACSYTHPPDVGPAGDAHPLDGTDLGPTDGPPADAYTCNAQGTYPQSTADSQIALGVRSQGPPFDVWQGGLGAAGGTLILQLSEGADPFVGGLHTGSFQMPMLGSGSGIVAAMAFDVDMNNNVSDWYVGVSGTLNVQQLPDAAGNGNFIGAFQNVSFVRVVTSNHQPTSTPATPMCTSLVQQLSFNATSAPM